MTLEQLISGYGLWAVFGGTFAEGETVLVLGGFFAHRGLMALPAVILCAAVASFISDQFYFHLARMKGISLIENRPRLKKRIAKLRPVLEKHRIPMIFGFRFIYGTRIAVPLLLGASGISPLLFLLCDLLTVAVWSVLFASLGYIFGQTVIDILNRLQHYEARVFTGLGLLVLLIFGLKYLRRRFSA